MPQVGEDVDLSEVPDRCGYAFTPGWVVEVEPAKEVVLEPAHDVPHPTDSEQVVHVPAVTVTMPPVVESVPPRARVLRLGLTEADLVDHEATVASLEADVPATREAWGCPPEAMVLVAYRFEV